MRASLLLVALISAGCFSAPRHETTSAGYMIRWNDNGTVKTGLHTRAEIFAAFDAAMLRSEAEVEKKWKIKSCGKYFRKQEFIFQLEDHFHFRATGVDYPDASFATGYWFGEMIQLAFYNKETPASAETQAKRPWTLYTGPQTGIIYGGVELPGQQFPALTYELENAMGFWGH